jgi:hypothetical protein
MNRQNILLSISGGIFTYGLLNLLLTDRIIEIQFNKRFIAITGSLILSYSLLK